MNEPGDGGNRPGRWPIMKGSTVMHRIKNMWRVRQARKARINQQLAEADAAERMRWVNATEPWTDEQRAALEGLLREPGTWEAS